MFITWTCQSMMTEDDDLAVRATALTSVSGGTVSHSESAASGPYDSSATGDCPAAGTGVSCWLMLYCHYSWGWGCICR